jgi:hypothetical protein
MLNSCWLENSFEVIADEVVDIVINPRDIELGQEPLNLVLRRLIDRRRLRNDSKTSNPHFVLWSGSFCHVVKTASHTLHGYFDRTMSRLVIYIACP